ncbi:MAG: hypothetical protein KIS96_15075 [Bauldia sp.]|nr:hypothetical protein [Bauldia sp.]
MDSAARPGIDGRIWWAAFALVAALLAVPFFLVAVPPVLDYPNHLARLTVLAFPDDPALAAMYEPTWRLVPNLAIDLVGPPLVRLLPVHVAGRMLLALAAFLPFAGAVALHRALFRRRALWPLGAAILAFNGVFLLGFVNFLYGAGVALLGAAAFVALSRRSRLAAAAAASVAGIVAFFCHPLALLFLWLLLAAMELDAWLRLPTAQDALRRVAWLAAIAAPALLLLALSAGGEGGAVVWSTPARKAVDALSPFLTYHQVAGVVVAAMVLTAFILVARRSVVSRAGLIALAAIALAFLAAPRAMLGGTFVDTRLPVLAGFIAFAAFMPRLTGRMPAIVGGLLGAALVLRVGEVAVSWSSHRTDLADFRAVIAPVEPGATVLVVSASSAGAGAAGEIPGLYRTDLHLPALLLIERRAFWPFLFADPRQQPVTIRESYAAIAAPLAEPQPLRTLAADLATLPGYLRDWPERFDYLLVLGAPPDDAPIAAALQLVRGSPIASLFAISGSR